MGYGDDRGWVGVRLIRGHYLHGSFRAVVRRFVQQPKRGKSLHRDLRRDRLGWLAPAFAHGLPPRFERDIERSGGSRLLRQNHLLTTLQSERGRPRDRPHFVLARRHDRWRSEVALVGIGMLENVRLTNDDLTLEPCQSGDAIAELAPRIAMRGAFPKGAN